jgi:hypothetical protein
MQCPIQPRRFALALIIPLLWAVPVLADGSSEAVRRPDPAPDWRLPGPFSGFTLSRKRTSDGIRPDGIFFQAGEGVAVGASGSIDLGSGNLRALLALRLDF